MNTEKTWAQEILEDYKKDGIEIVPNGTVVTSKEYLKDGDKFFPFRPNAEGKTHKEKEDNG